MHMFLSVKIYIVLCLTIAVTAKLVTVLLLSTVVVMVVAGLRI